LGHRTISTRVGKSAAPRGSRRLIDPEPPHSCRPSSSERAEGFARPRYSPSLSPGMIDDTRFLLKYTVK
jgi:hypothetical protein